MLGLKTKVGWILSLLHPLGGCVGGGGGGVALRGSHTCPYLEADLHLHVPNTSFLYYLQITAGVSNRAYSGTTLPPGASKAN